MPPARSRIGVARREGSGILVSIVMPTSVHLPRSLLEAVDRKARALRISRNQLVVRALQRELRSNGSEWSPGFFARLSQVDPETPRGVDEMLRAIRKARRSKAAPRW
jgi:hypothetical protein